MVGSFPVLSAVLLLAAAVGASWLKVDIDIDCIGHFQKPHVWCADFYLFEQDDFSDEVWYHFRECTKHRSLNHKVPYFDGGWDGLTYNYDVRWMVFHNCTQYERFPRIEEEPTCMCANYRNTKWIPIGVEDQYLYINEKVGEDDLGGGEYIREKNRPCYIPNNNIFDFWFQCDWRDAKFIE